MKGASWLYWIENNGRRIYRIGQQEQSKEQIQEDLKTIFRICLRHLGAELDQSRYVLWPSQLN